MALAISDEIKSTLTRSCNSQAQNYYNNNYSLNIEKSLKKKLECTKRSEIQYTATGGGITVELDAVSFELQKIKEVEKFNIHFKFLMHHH